MLPLFILIPLIAAITLAFADNIHKRLSDWLAIASTTALCFLSLSALAAVIGKGSVSYNVGGWAAPMGITMSLDGLSVLFLVLINCLGFLVCVYSSGYMENSAHKARYYFFFMTLMAGLNGVLIASDLFNAFVFTELASVSAYVLASFDMKDECLEASFKYAVLGSVSSLLILLAIALIYAKTSSLSFLDISRTLPARSSGSFSALLAVLLVTGFGLKAAMVPFHTWAPDAYSAAPSPVSALFAGAVGKVLGIYMLVRLFFNVIGASPVMLNLVACLGTLSIVVGVTLALYQWDFKRLLAYHSISQVGYIMLGIGLGTPLGIFGGLFHLINHTTFKSLLFLNAGSIERAAGTRNLTELGGLSKKLPVTGATSMVASLSISGVPPFNGFWSKLIIIIACVCAHSYWFALFAVLASILTLASFLKVQRYAFYGYLKEALSGIKESPLSMTIPMIILAVMCVFLGMLLLPGIDSGFLGNALSVIQRGRDCFSVLAGLPK